MAEQSAFGNAPDVWDVGLGGDDMDASAPPVAETAPRPEPQSSDPGAHRAPARTPVTKASLPGHTLPTRTPVAPPRQAQPAQPHPVAPGQQRPAGGLPGAPAPHARPQAQPAPAPAPQAQPAPAPEPVYAPAPLPEPHVAPEPAYTPSWAVEATPEPAHYETPATDPLGPVDSFAPDYDPAPPVPSPVGYAPAPEPVAQGTGRGKKSRKAKKTRGKPAKDGVKADTAKPKGSPFAGGRWKTFTIRALFWTVLVLLLINGCKAVLAEDTPVTADEIAAKAAAKVAYNGFPMDSAEAFSIRFADVYLTYSAETLDARSEQLRTYSVEAADGLWGPDAQGTQQVTSGPYVASKPEMIDSKHAMITVTARVTSGKWVYLAVPVYASSKGDLVVSGPPAFVSPPALAVAPSAGGEEGDDSTTAVDDELGAALTGDLFTGFFTAWAGGDANQIDRFVTADATPQARNGLGGTVTFANIDEVLVAEEGGKTRDATVSITWSAGAAGSYVQTYRVKIVQGADKRWSIADVRGGMVSPDGTTDGGEDAAIDPATGETTDPNDATGLG